MNTSCPKTNPWGTPVVTLIKNKSQLFKIFLTVSSCLSHFVINVKWQCKITCQVWQQLSREGRSKVGAESVQIHNWATQLLLHVFFIITSQMVDTVWMWRGCDDVSFSALVVFIINLSSLWSFPMGVWDLGFSNESSWVIMSVPIQVCFDEIPPDWSQITEQNSRSSLTTVTKAILTGEYWVTIPSGYFTLFSLRFTPPPNPSFFLCDHWLRWNQMSVSTAALAFRSKSLHFCGVVTRPSYAPYLSLKTDKNTPRAEFKQMRPNSLLCFWSEALFCKYQEIFLWAV